MANEARIADDKQRQLDGVRVDPAGTALTRSRACGSTTLTTR